jgi:DNA-binding response OmpR family regulator
MRGTVLVVDDDPGVRRCLGEFLEAEGYKVLGAPHGRAALAVLEDERPSLLLIDLAMPVMNGLKLVEALSHYPDLARIPRIMMVDRGQTAVAAPRRGPRAGDQVIEKPLNMSGVSAALTATLRAASATAAA